MDHDTIKEEASETTAAGPVVKHVILLIHGICSDASWNQTVKRAIGDDPSVEIVPVKYGHFSALRFLLPGDRCKKQRDLLSREYRDSQAKWPNAKISIIAHSFGTHILTQLLNENSSITLERVVLCGAVIKQDYDWGLIAHRIGSGRTDSRRSIVNDCGNKDCWPLLGAKFGCHYGQAGTDGSSGPHVEDRFHDGSHGLFFKEDFIKKYWASFLLEDGKIIPGDAEPGEKIPWYIRPLRVVNAFFLKLIVLLLFIAAALVIYWILFAPKHISKDFGVFMEDYRDSLANETRFKRFKGDFEDKKITLKNVDNTVWKPNYSGEKNHYLTGMKFEKGYLIIAVLKDNIKEEYSQKEGPFDITGVVTDIGRSAPILRQCIFTKIKKPKTPQ